MCAHSPLSGSSVNESCAQDTEQKHGKHGSGAPLSSFPQLLVVVLAEHVVACPLSIATVSCESGTSAMLVGTSVRLVGGESGTSAELVGTSVRLVAG